MLGQKQKKKISRIYSVLVAHTLFNVPFKNELFEIGIL